MKIVIMLLIATIPMILGMFWYSKKGFGDAWMKGAGLTAESAEGANMPLMFGLSYFFCLLAVLFLHSVVIHQDGLASLVGGDPASLTGDLKAHYDALAADTVGNFRTFKHGVLHGIIAAVLFALPVFGMGALFERRSMQYIFINLGFWVISCALMGGLICQFM